MLHWKTHLSDAIRSCNPGAYGLILAGVLGILPAHGNLAAAEAGAVKITAVRGKAVSLYGQPKGGTPDRKVAAAEVVNQLATPDGTRLRIKLGGETYWVNKFNVKTDKKIDVTVHCEQPSSASLGSTRGIGGGCDQ